MNGGEFIRAVVAAMDRRKMSRSDLAAALKVSRPYVTQVLSGKANLTFKTAAALAKAVGLRVKVATEDSVATSRSPAQEKLFKASGSVVLHGKLEALLYLLMRDHVPPGVIGGLLQDLEAGDGECSFTNGWLAQYAQYVAQELRFVDLRMRRRSEGLSGKRRRA